MVLCALFWYALLYSLFLVPLSFLCITFSPFPFILLFLFHLFYNHRYIDFSLLFRSFSLLFIPLSSSTILIPVVIALYYLISLCSPFIVTFYFSLSLSFLFLSFSQSSSTHSQCTFQDDRQVIYFSIYLPLLSPLFPLFYSPYYTPSSPLSRFPNPFSSFPFLFSLPLSQLSLPSSELSPYPLYFSVLPLPLFATDARQ